MRYMSKEGKSYSFNDLQNPHMFDTMSKDNYYEAYEEKPIFRCIISQYGVNINQGNLCLYDIKRVRDAGFNVLVQENDPLLKGVFDIDYS